MDELFRLAVATLIASGVVGGVRLGMAAFRRLGPDPDWSDNSNLSH